MVGLLVLLRRLRRCWAASMHRDNGRIALLSRYG